MAKLTNGYNVVIQQKVGTTNKPIYPFTHSANVINADGDSMDTVISNILAKNFVPDYSSETASSLRFLRNDNTWATIQSASTTQAGVVSLSSALNSDSETVAATSAAAKSLKDALDTLNGTVETTGSVLKMIKDNAKDATYDADHTIAEAIAAMGSAGVVNVVKQETAESGYSATYYVTQGGTQVGAKINIPKDYLVKSASVKTCTKDDDPVKGYKVGDKYIDFVINTTEGSGTESHLYLLVTDLVDVYTGVAVDNGISVAISSDNKISASVSGKAIARANITDAFESDIAALEGTHAAAASGTGFKSVSTQIDEEAKDATYTAATESAAKVTISGAISALETKVGSDTVAKQIKDAVEALDASVSQTAGADGLALSVTEVDGKLTAVTGSIAANTYDAYGAASDVQGDTTETVKSVDTKAETNKSAIEVLNGDDTKTGSVAKKIKDAVEALDATVSQTAGADGLALSVTEVDGKLTAVSGSIAANTYDAYGDAAAVQGNTTATVKSVEDAVAKLNGAVTADGSVLKMIKDNAKDATYDSTHTIAEAIDAMGSAGVVSVVKQETAESGYFASYYVTQGGTQVGAKINIPKDYLVKSASVKTCTKDDDPVAGYKVGDKYIDFVVNSVDGTGNESHIYLLVKELVDVYTGVAVDNGISVAVSTDNKISATVSGKAIARTNITDAFEADIAALEGTHAAATGGGFKSVSTQISEEAQNAVYGTGTATIKSTLDSILDSTDGILATAKKYTDDAVAALDATATQTAGTDAIAASVTEVDGKVTAVSVSQTAATASANGYMTKEYAAKLDNCAEIAVSAAAPTFSTGNGIWFQVVSEDA